MASLDVKSLFTNTPLEETTGVCSDSLFSNDAKVNNINRIDFEKLLTAALQNNFFNFEGQIYKQIDEVTTGSHLGPTLGNAFFCFHEQIWLNDVLMNSNLHTTKNMLMTYLFSFVHLIILKKFKNYLNSKHRNIGFTREKEHNNSMPYSGHFNYQNQQWFQNICVSQTHI